jgi:hypothetical protein
MIVCDCCNCEVPIEDAERIEESVYVDGEEIPLYWCNECLTLFEESLI